MALFFLLTLTACQNRIAQRVFFFLKKTRFSSQAFAVNLVAGKRHAAVFVSFSFLKDLKKWRRGNIALIYNTTGARLSKIGSTFAALSGGQIPQQSRKEHCSSGTSAHPTLQSSGLAACTLAKEIRKMTAQGCKCQLLVVKETSHKRAPNVLRHNFQDTVPGLVLTFLIRAWSSPSQEDISSSMLCSHMMRKPNCNASQMPGPAHIFQCSQPYVGSWLDLLHAAQIVEHHVSFASFKAKSALAFLLHLTAWCNSFHL